LSFGAQRLIDDLKNMSRHWRQTLCAPHPGGPAPETVWGGTHNPLQSWTCEEVQTNVQFLAHTGIESFLELGNYLKIAGYDGFWLVKLYDKPKSNLQKVVHAKLDKILGAEGSRILRLAIVEKLDFDDEYTTQQFRRGMFFSFLFFFSLSFTHMISFFFRTKETNLARLRVLVLSSVHLFCVTLKETITTC